MQTLHWSAEADEYLRRFGQTAPTQLLAQKLGITVAQIKARAEVLNIPLRDKIALCEPFAHAITQMLDWPALPIDSLPTQWNGGLISRIENPPIKGIKTITIHRQYDPQDESPYLSKKDGAMRKRLIESMERSEYQTQRKRSEKENT